MVDNLYFITISIATGAFDFEFEQILRHVSIDQIIDGFVQLNLNVCVVQFGDGEKFVIVRSIDPLDFDAIAWVGA